MDRQLYLVAVFFHRKGDVSFRVITEITVELGDLLYSVITDVLRQIDFLFVELEFHHLSLLSFALGIPSLILL